MPVTIQTKSPLVIRDLELQGKIKNLEVGLSIATADENIRRMFEPNSTPINDRIQALETLHSAHIKTFAMIAPVLPKAEDLPEQLENKVDHVLVDKMNYHYADWVYKKFKLEYSMNNNFFNNKKKGIPARLLF